MKVVLVERADRLARDLMVSEVIIDQLTRAGAKVLTADGADFTSAEGDPTRTLIRQVLGAVAQFDKSVTVLKLRAARERIRRRDGRCEGRKPFGSRPAEAAALERIRQLRRKPKGAPRLSVAAIAARLNSEAVPWKDGGFVFTTPKGTPLDACNVSKQFKALLKAAELAPLRIHDLRHSCATLLLAQGVNARTIMETLGHSQISLTLNTYSHVLPELQREAAAKLDGVLGS